MMFAILSAVMCVLITLSMLKLKNFLWHFKENDLKMLYVTIFIQVVLLGIIAIFTFAYFFTKERFFHDCEDDLEGKSSAAMMTRTF